MKFCAVRSWLGKFFLALSILFVVPVQAQTTTWTQIAREGFNFTLTAPGTVRYGANSKWVQRNFTAGTYRCTNETFSFDPFPRKAKTCQLASTTAPPPVTWTFVANEGSQFNLTKTANVRYGANGLFLYVSRPAGTHWCTNDAFMGDPIPGTVKTCDVSDATAIGTLIQPTYSITPSNTAVNEGSSITLSIVTTNVANTTLYYTIEPVVGSVAALDFLNPLSAGITITNNSGSLLLTTVADAITEGSEQFIIRLRTSSSVGAVVASSAVITINDTSLTPVTPPPTTGGGLDANMMPIVDRSLIMTPRLGSSTVDIVPTTEIAPIGDIGAFRTVCVPSHMNFDDPIIFPGQQNRTHLHVYFGNTGTNYATTPATLASTGNGTCRGGVVNRSAYWMPAMIDIRNGKPIVPDLMHVYYKSGYNAIPLESINYIPNGLRVIAGNSPATTSEVSWDAADVRFQCFGPVANGPVLKYIPVCAPGDIVWISLNIPNCWDGINLDSPDHRSHMTHSWLWGPGGGSCPASHPVALPQITLIIVYNVTSTDDTSKWRLSSDMYGLDKPGGYSLHGDLMFGWREDIMKAFIDNCTKARRDCRSHLLGDGREIFGER